MTGLPALGAAYFSLSELWDLPNGEKVVGTIAIITTFLGVLLRIITKQYYNSDAAYDGAIIAQHDNGTLRYSLELGMDPADIENRNSVAFRVKPPVPPAFNMDEDLTF